MPKMKTNRSAAKRLSRSASGKFWRAHAYRRHLLTAKPSKLRRALRCKGGVPPGDAKRIARLLPYS